MYETVDLWAALPVGESGYVTEISTSAHHGAPAYGPASCGDPGDLRDPQPGG